MELIQFHVAGRVTSFGDIEANAIGTACGALVSGLVDGRSGWRLLRPLRSDAGAALVAASWLGYRLYPYLPAADMHKYWRAIRDIVLAPHVDPFDLLRFAASWMLIAILVERLYGRNLARFLFTPLLAATLLARILIVDVSLTLSELAGAATAWTIWMLAPPSRPRVILLAIVFTGVVCALRLQPYTFEDTGRRFGWVPLVSLMHGSPGVAIQSFLEKMFLYGGLTWLIREATGSLAVAMAIATTLVFLTSLLELYLPGRSAEITDAVLALSAGIVLALLPVSQAVAPTPPSSR
jgi:VanZ family protein